MTVKGYLQFSYIAAAVFILATKGINGATIVSLFGTGLFFLILYWLKVAGENNPPSDSSKTSMLAYYSRKFVLALLTIATFVLVVYLLILLSTQPTLLKLLFLSISLKLLLYFYLTAFTKVRIFKPG